MNKPIVVSLIFLTNMATIQYAAADTTDASKCFLLNASDKHIVVNDNTHNNNSDFKFVIASQNVAEVEPLISNNQLIDLRRQLIVADSVYRRVLGLNPPLLSSRYQNARYIRVEMKNMNSNGLAYDEVTADNAIGSSDCRINMALKSTLQAPNGSPAHELFHLYQNSYSVFKNSWFAEGTARWSESLLSNGTGASTTLPQTCSELEAIMQSTYTASTMWTRLFQLVDSNNSFIIPSTANLTKYLNGTSVIKDNKAYGTSFIKVLFEELEKQSKQASIDKGWSRYSWQEADQKSAANNPYIWKAVQNAVNKTVPVDQQSPELKIFINLALNN